MIKIVYNKFKTQKIDQMSLKDFITIKKLGEGSFGTVEKVRRIADGSEYAMKKVKYMDLKDKDKRNALNEIRILASIQHPNVISYKEAFFDEPSRMLCTVMELAASGDLAGRIKQKVETGDNFYQFQIWSMGKDIVNGIAALHERKIIHRDIKPANIFFSQSGQAKIGDLNVSLLMKGHCAYTQTGTPYYASPQVWENQPYGYQCDIWSIGCVLYELCTLKKPFQAKGIDKLYEKVKKLKYNPLPYRFSNDLIDVVSRCLTSRSKRISMKELKRIFEIHNAPKSYSNETKNSSQSSLIDTIKVPFNKNDLAFCLPQAKYQNSEQIKFNTETSIEENPSILDSFLSPVKRLPLKTHGIARSEKHLKPIQSSNSLLQPPSFKEVLSIKSPPKSILNEISPEQLRRRRIKITMAH